MENCHQMPGLAVESPVTFAAVEIQIEGSQAVGLVGKASVGMDFEIWEAEETELDEGSLQAKERVKFQFVLGVSVAVHVNTHVYMNMVFVTENNTDVRSQGGGWEIRKARWQET